MARVIDHRRQRACGHLSGAAAGGGRPPGRQRQPRHARALPAACRLGRGRDGHRRIATAEESAGTFGQRIAALERRHRHRHDRLHAAEHAASGRGAARQGRAFPPLRHDLGLWPQSGGAGDRGRSAQRLRRATARKRPRSRPGCSARRAARAFRRRCSVRATSSGPAGRRSIPAGHFKSTVFSQIARGDELALPNFGLETVHHVHADDVAQVVVQAIAEPRRPRSARRSTPCRRRR